MGPSHESVVEQQPCEEPIPESARDCAPVEKPSFVEPSKRQLHKRPSSAPNIRPDSGGRSSAVARKSFNPDILPSGDITHLMDRPASARRGWVRQAVPPGQDGDRSVVISKRIPIFVGRL